MFSKLNKRRIDYETEFNYGYCSGYATLFEQCTNTAIAGGTATYAFDYEVAKQKVIKDYRSRTWLNCFYRQRELRAVPEKTLKYYKATIQAMIDSIGKCIKYIVTDDIRCYLTEYQSNKNSSKVTIDNIRRILSSFFSWLEDEDYILKSPVRRIHKVKTGTNIKETYSDEALELMRDNCTELRDLAMIDMLASTGMQ